MKRNQQAEDILKENYQAFGTIITKALTLEEAFSTLLLQFHYLLQY